MAEDALYQVEVWNVDEYVAAFLALPPSQQDRVSDLFNNHLPRRPSQVRPPALKRLHGAHQHLFQFEAGECRLIYTIEEAMRTVRIVYLGKHPEWEKFGKTSSLG